MRGERHEDRNREVEDDEFDTTGDCTDEIAEPIGWLGKAGWIRVAAAVPLGPNDTNAFLMDPDRFLQSPITGEGLEALSNFKSPARMTVPKNVEVDRICPSSGVIM